MAYNSRKIRSFFIIVPLFFFFLSIGLNIGLRDSMAVSAAGGSGSLRIITLNEAYNLAAHKNGTIKASREKYYRSTLLKWSAASIMFPKIEFNFSDQRMHQNSPPVPAGADNATTSFLFSSMFTFFFPNHEYDFMLEQPILDFGVIPAFHSAENLMMSEKNRLNAISADTLYSVASLYYSVLNDKSLVAANLKTYKEAKAHMELAQAKLEAGLAIKTDTLQARAQFYSAKEDLINSENSLKSDKARLQALIGVNGDFDVVAPYGRLGDEDSLQKCITEAYENNAGLKSVQYLKKSANNEKTFYETGFLPTVNFKATYSALSSDDFVPDGSTNYWTAGAYLTLPLFESGTRVIALEKARSAANEAMYGVMQFKRDLKARVITDYYNVKNIKDEIFALKYEEKFASQNYGLVEEEYKDGVATSVDVVTALANLVKARHTLLSAELKYDNAVLGLKKLTGSFQKKLITLTVDRFN